MEKKAGDDLDTEAFAFVVEYEIAHAICNRDCIECDYHYMMPWLWLNRDVT